VTAVTGYAWHDVLGNIGVLLILGTYAALQSGRLAADAMSYSVCNAAGAGLITLSLLFDFNLSAFVVEAAWVAVSIYGIVRVVRRREA
jgi:paired small multidrug resistance pump